MFSSRGIIKIDVLLAHSVVFMDWRLPLSNIFAILIWTISNMAILIIVVLILLRLKIVFGRVVGQASSILLSFLWLLSLWGFTMAAL